MSNATVPATHVPFSTYAARVPVVTEADIDAVYAAFPLLAPAISVPLITNEAEAIAFAQEEVDKFIKFNYSIASGLSRDYAATFRSISWNRFSNVWDVVFNVDNI
jgi:TRAP-type uncharacterized transport system substrate-binding protein